MAGIKNYKALTALVATLAIAVVLTGSIHGALAFFGRGTLPGNSITNTINNQGINVQTDTDQKQDCQTTGGSSGIANSCQASSTDHVSQSGGNLKK
jgi:hypothetical protein